MICIFLFLPHSKNDRFRIVLLQQAGYLTTTLSFLSPFYHHPSPPSWSILFLFPLLFSVHKAISPGNKSVSEGLLWKLTSLIESNEAWTQGGRKEKVSRLRTFNEYWILDHSLSFHRHTHTHTRTQTQQMFKSEDISPHPTSMSAKIYT